ncbi:MAG: glutamine--fructose-6-phosphate transaminase (isomerizing) [Bacteriovoracaceae bacterium]|nr:glutamine--fructose-6-phosphate transaminase (isomerizing) [Bacteriovoracaceae bacterium]
MVFINVKIILPRGLSMCGIVGHFGPQNSVEIVLEGLKRLEYRGYDSAGVSFIDEKENLNVFKKSGKLQNLKDHLGEVNFTARSCIGHTRWATHGEVNDENSHPHSNNEIALVHNGIIENATYLRKQLQDQGFKFQSETDSEVFLGLLAVSRKKGLSFKETIIESFVQIEGNSAFVILDSQTSDIFAFKRGAPLVAGINEISSEVLVSSDPYALAGMVNKIYFPEDNVICHLSASNKNLLNFYEMDGTTSTRYLSKMLAIDAAVSEKGDFEHFMLKEIHEQPELIRSLTQYYFDGEGLESLKRISKIETSKIHISACGTAFYAGLLIRDFFERFNRINCTVELASEFRYRNPIIDSKDLGLFISQSGETADTLAAHTLCKNEGIKTISIVNTEGSTLYREATDNLLIRAGIEVGVASTKAFTQQVLTGRLFSAALEGVLNNEEEKKKLVNKYALLAERVDELLLKIDEIKEVAEKIYNYNGFFFTGRGAYYPVALEGALKLKEIAYVHAEGYAAGELKHGPIALIDHRMVNVAIIGPELFEKTISNISEIKTRKGIIVTIGEENNSELENISDYYIQLNLKGLDELRPTYINIVNQLLSYYIAKLKGTDIDKPRNLAKSVTVE